MSDKLYTAKDVEALRSGGGCFRDIPADAVLTPSARDLVRAWQNETRQKGNPGKVYSETPSIPDYEFRWEAGKDPQTPEAIQAFFTSPEIEVLKRRMVDIGRRMWERDFTDGNGGNLTIRVGDNLVLCTPTLISKGFMTPEDICLVDLDGKQLAGSRKRTSEVMTHIGIMKQQPKAKSCCHAHPPHATAFAVAKVQPPTCLIPEAEVFLGQIGIAAYQTPGTPANAEEVGRIGKDHQCVLMANHGVITWGDDIEDAYWKMENADAYCRTIWIAGSLGKELTPIEGGQARELIDLRRSLGMDDYREDWKECQLCDNSDFHPGFVGNPEGMGSCSLPGNRDGGGSKTGPDPEAEAVVKAVTDEILKQLKGS